MGKRHKFVKEHKEEIKALVREYFEDFIEEDINKVDNVFNEEKYLESAMEGELFETVNNEFDEMVDGESLFVLDGSRDSEKAYDLLDELVDEVLLEPGMEVVKAYFDSTLSDY